MLYIVWLMVGLVVGVGLGIGIAVSNIKTDNDKFELFGNKYIIR